uniref:Uncharacterized protein n=1 Tax=Globodera pallida TaxID=36090 RepID=A0A183BWK3_GLOPA
MADKKETAAQSLPNAVSIFCQPFPVVNSNCFARLGNENHPNNNNKNLRPKLVLTVLPEVDEKEVIVQHSQKKPLLGGTEPPATNVNSNGAIGMEEVADKLRQSALQAAIAKRRHLSLAEQALIELEKEDEAQTNESIGDNKPRSEPINDGILISSVSKMSGENVKSREDDVDTPPPKKHGRAG